MTDPLTLLDFLPRRQTPIIYQSEASECGLACLAMVAAAHGLDIDLLAIRRRFSVSLKGTTLRQLIEVAQKMSFNARPLRGEIGSLDALELPAILHWDLNHFVVLTKVRRRFGRTRYTIHDPAVGVAEIGDDEISKRWTGVALEIFPAATFVPRIERQAMRISQLWSSIVGLGRSLRQLILLSTLLQLAALAAPFYLQAAIDTAYPAGDQQLLVVLAMGFGGLALIEFAANWLRSYLLVHLSNSLSYQVTVNLFRHLLHLPLPWFEKRHVGDVISRFGSTVPITQLIGNGLVASMIDGVMALVTFGLMVVYSPILALVALAALATYTVVRVAFFRMVRMRNISAIATSAIEQTAFIESVRGVSAIKSFGQEGNRQRLWQKKKADAVNASIRLGRLGAGFDALSGFITATERVIFVYLAVRFALDGRITVGMIFAFQAYKQQFLQAGIRLVEQAINLTLIQAHLLRISDIAFSHREDLGFDNFAMSEPVGGTIEIEKVSFRYGIGEPEVLRDVSLTVTPGEMIALVGPSGGGKTTLLKMMMGLFEPSTGRILIDGRPLKGASRLSYRSQIGSVAQADVLFNGTLAENIAFFDANIDWDRVVDVSKLACIHDEIKRMPLGYDSLVGDMGTVLSGGQRQRVLLARALYSRPAILFMDEGTANLDERTERSVIDILKSLEITRVVIAHRSQAIDAADRVYRIEDGSLSLVEDRCPDQAGIAHRRDAISGDMELQPMEG